MSEAPKITVRLERTDAAGNSYRADLTVDSLPQLVGMIPLAWPMLFPDEEMQRHADLLSALRGQL